MIDAEIESQPEAWRRAARTALEAADSLPQRGRRLAIIGCGTSYYIAQAMAGLREASGGGETDAFPASEAPLERPYEAVLAVSRSGTTTEVLEALSHVPEAVSTMAICAVAETPIARTAGRTVLLGFADERAVVQTRFATTALALFRAHLQHGLDGLPASGLEALSEPLPGGLEAFRHFVFLGSGWGIGLAHEAALKLREAAGVWTESYPAMEYRHGPISAATRHTLVWGVGKIDETVLADAAETGATVVNSRRDPMVELILIQRAAVALARARGLDPDKPPNLSRSVVLQTVPKSNARPERGMVEK